MNENEKLLKKLTIEKQSFADLRCTLNQSTETDKINWQKTLSSKDQAWLFEKSSPITSLDEIINSNEKDLTEIIFKGKNTLPAFNYFEKRMCLSKDKNLIIGYNHQSLQKIVGPGYFIIEKPQDKLMVDYTILPNQKVESWPKIKSNHSGLSYLVYKDLKDELRKIADGIFIGLATKKGKSLGQYFILIRK
jgi:hypothetical protein